jgi:hypothetical protein
VVKIIRVAVPEVAPVILTGVVDPKLTTGGSFAPDGPDVTAAVRATLPVKPPLGLTRIVSVPVWPGLETVTVEVPGCRVKVPEAAGPVETTRFTAELGAALLPAGGVWLMTLPDGTLALAAVVTVPTVSPAPVIAAVAAAWVSPTTLGTVTIAGPVETTRFTAEPDAALLPAGGVWLMTLPDGTLALAAVVTVPSVNPAPVIAEVAAAWVSPTTLGTVTIAAVTVTVFMPDALV